MNKTNFNFNNYFIINKQGIYEKYLNKTLQEKK